MTTGYPSEEPIAGKPHDGICGGESQQWLSYPTSVRNCWGGRPHGIKCQNWGCEQPRPEPSMTQYKRIGVDTPKPCSRYTASISKTDRC